MESLNTLRDHGLINMDEGFDLKPTGTTIFFKLIIYFNNEMIY